MLDKCIRAVEGLCTFYNLAISPTLKEAVSKQHYSSMERCDFEYHHWLSISCLERSSYPSSHISMYYELIIERVRIMWLPEAK